MKKADRIKIFNKYNGKCAYCGVELQKGWHVDHLIPIRRNYDLYGKCIGCMNSEQDTLENKMPSCPSCNINKHSMELEGFRRLIGNFMKHLNEVSTQYKIAKRYGLITETIKPIVFYFETIKKNNRYESESKSERFG